MNRWLAASTFVLASCSSQPVDGALLALVDFGAGTTCRCVQVVVRTKEGTEQRSAPVKTDRTRPVKVGIGKASLPNEVTVYAVGFADERCMSPSMPPERSEDGDGTFKVGRVSTVALTVVRRANQKDDDGDGYASDVSGGDDCNDADPAVHPGAMETCDDEKDNDCDRATDCEEAACAMKACGSGTGATCKPPKCAESLCTDDVDNDGDGPADCMDTDCKGLTCRNSGTCNSVGVCVNATTEQNLCADGQDNDGDGKVDCADSDCLNAGCNSGDPCLKGATCGANGLCGGGQPVTCTTPGSACRVTAGTCNPADGGCLYAPDPGKPCNDDNGCTMNDACSDAGVCTGAPIACTPPALCLRSAACVPDAGCVFEPAVGDTCSDGDLCTGGEKCQADAGCGGGTVGAACVPSACQTFNNVCSGDGGCAFGARDAGTACDGGVCNAGGACIPSFPYPPSNFTESQVPTPGGPTSLGCVVAVDTHAADGGVNFGGWCGQAEPPYRLLPRGVGQPDVVLLGFSDLEVGLDASVRLQGDRPVIFAATGNLKVLGEVFGLSGAATCADGGAGGAANGDNGGGGGGFGTVGAAGGKGGAGAGGIPNGEPALVPLRGGCPGGNNTRGGGGVQLSAAGNLTITGTVAAPGRGGTGGTAPNNAGNAGGSGGGVLLEGLFVLVGPTGAVTANGGAGGEGAGLFLAGNGGAAGSTRTADPAAGGESLNGGGSGGNGAAGSTAATGGAGSLLNGGGGGGAGLGRVRINAATGCSLGGTAVFSPRPTSAQVDAGCT